MMSNQNLSVIDVGVVHTSQPSVTSGMKHTKMRESRPYPKSMPLRKGSELYPKTKDENPDLHSFEVEDERIDDSLVASLEVNNVNHGVVGDVIWVKPKVNGHTLKMELDTGSAISTLPLETYKDTFPNRPLVDTTAILKTYSGDIN